MFGPWANVPEVLNSPHVGEDDFRVVLNNLDGGNRTTRDRLIPYCLFIDPELAHVGLTESDAQSRGLTYRLAKQPMTAVLRSHTLSETRRIRQSFDRRRRPHPRLYGPGRRGQRNDGGGSDGNARRSSLYRLA